MGALSPACSLFSIFNFWVKEQGIFIISRVFLEGGQQAAFFTKHLERFPKVRSDSTWLEQCASGRE